MTLALIKAIIIGEAIRQGFNPSIALAVAQVESNFAPTTIGAIGERGLFQIRPQFSQILVPDLFNPRLNAREGVRQLKYWQKKCPLDFEFLGCYSGGIRNKNATVYRDKVLEALKND